jgi:flagellin
MYSIGSNAIALNAITNSQATSRDIANSLAKLSSGHRINKAADDASGMSIADSLRTQAKSLDQAIRNANDAIGILQIADKALDEQVKILDSIKVKAIQSAQDGQTADTRSALQADISRLMEELDNIANTTSFNGKSLLSGGFTNQRFQIGAYSNTTINASIGATSSDKIGQTRFETGQAVTQSSEVTPTFLSVNGRDDITLESVFISHSVGTGIGTLAEVINKNSNELYVRASWKVLSTGNSFINSGDIHGLTINDIKLGDINDVKQNDSDGKITAAINNLSDQTGVRASIDPRGRLELNSIDGRGISIKADNDELSSVLALDSNEEGEHANYGRLTLIRNDARDIILGGDANKMGFGDEDNIAEAIINLRSIRGSYSANQASAMGAHPNKNHRRTDLHSKSGMATGVTTMEGAQSVLDIVDTSIRMLDKVRSDLGSVQIQLEATVNNISATRINVKFSESQIRDVDYAYETSYFKSKSILAQAGSYAIAQSSAMHQNIQRLLQ